MRMHNLVTIQTIPSENKDCLNMILNILELKFFQLFGTVKMLWSNVEHLQLLLFYVLIKIFY